MRNDHHRTPAPDFTTACIVMFGINVAWIFMVLWAVWGLAAVALSGWAINFMIARMQARRAYAEAPDIT